MLYITGDTHGETDRFFETGFVGESRLGKGDLVIVCGDFGFVFWPEDPAFSRYFVEERRKLDILAEKPYEILFVDGNHENFDRLDSLPVEMRYGGRVHRIRDNIFHLMRGEIYDILGYRIFTFGGALSIDRASRHLGQTYWTEELPSAEDYRNAARNLEKWGYRVDIVITHTVPMKAMLQLGCYPDDKERELVGFLDWILHDVSFDRWFFGHWHRELHMDKLRGLMFDVECLPSKERESQCETK